MGPTQAAADAGQATLIFALTTSGILIFILGSLVWWLVRERMSLTTRRFEAGAQRMAKTDDKIDRMEESLPMLVSRDECRTVHARHEAIHDRLTQHMDHLVQGMAELTSSLGALSTRLEAALATMTRTFARHVRIEARPEDATDG